MKLGLAERLRGLGVGHAGGRRQAHRLEDFGGGDPARIARDAVHQHRHALARQQHGQQRRQVGHLARAVVAGDQHRRVVARRRRQQRRTSASAASRKPAISSTDSPLMRMASMMPPISRSDTRPSSMAPYSARASSRDKLREPFLPRPISLMIAGGGECFVGCIHRPKLTPARRNIFIEPESVAKAAAYIPAPPRGEHSFEERQHETDETKGIHRRTDRRQPAGARHWRPGDGVEPPRGAVHHARIRRSTPPTSTCSAATRPGAATTPR